LTALGASGALYLGIIAGLLEIIPTIGPIIAAVPDECYFFST
jgi:predicted PurR-regulated permease PerM